MKLLKDKKEKIMNDDIRYNVLKRDNFTCQKCGITSKDGANLRLIILFQYPKVERLSWVIYKLYVIDVIVEKNDKTKEDFETNDVCPRCGGTLVKRNGKYGTFMGCSNYPKCRYIKK